MVNFVAGKIRIIGGNLRGRKLNVLQAEGLRPTANRVRETLFNWLQFKLDNACVLDAFCGSGALMFEALSRGAKCAVALDTNQQIIKNLNSNLIKLNCNKEQNIIITNKNAVEFLATKAKLQFNVVFLDPPFNLNLLQTCCNLLEANNWLAQDALIYCEDNKPISNLIVPPNWQLYRNKCTANVHYGLFKRNALT